MEPGTSPYGPLALRLTDSPRAVPARFFPFDFALEGALRASANPWPSVYILCTTGGFCGGLRKTLPAGL